jgi:hypothetical protein
MTTREWLELERVVGIQQMCYMITMSRVRVTVIVVELQCELHILIEFLYSYLSLRHGKRIHRITVSFVACLALPDISILSFEQQIFEKILEHRNLL